MAPVVSAGRLGKGFHVSAGSDRFGAKLFYLNGRFDCKVSAKDTAGDLCIYDTFRTTRGGPPLHIHHDQDEWFFVREGQFVFQVGDDTFQLKPGDSVFGPRKVPHAFVNVTETGALMIAYQPAGTIEQFFLDGSLFLAPPTPTELQALYRKHRLEIVGPSLRVDHR
jgi:mannose-6-phosphate isomerase-like protein (cupin superfamily)